MIGRAFSRLGWGLLAIVVAAGIGGWLVYLQRLQLEQDNRRELAKAARELGTTLNELSSTANRFFRNPLNQSAARAEEFRRRNPFITGWRHSNAPAQTPCREERSGLSDPRRLSVLADPNVPAAEPRRLDFTVSPEAIFDDLVISPAFTYLFIADDEGHVKVQIAHGAASQRRADRGWLARRAGDDSGREGASIRIEHLAALETTPGQPLNLAALSGASGARSLYLGDEVYQLYTYPVRITTVDADECPRQSTWIVGGLVDPQHMWREALTISPEWMLLLFVLLIVCVAGEPFVKLIVLDPAERFRFADACLFPPSAAFLLVLATILLLDVGTSGQVKSTSAKILEALADRVEGNLAGELRDMRDELGRYDRRLAEACPEQLDQVELLNDRQELRAPSGYRDFRQIFWLGASGMQTLKGSVRSESTGFQNVRERTYFTEAAAGHLWSFGSDAREPEIFVQSFRSITTGELNTALSMRSAASRPCGAGMAVPVVAAMSTVPLSIDRPLLPAGYSFAIMGLDGFVLYHSDRRRTLKENLFEELGDPERLAAAVRARAPQRFMTTYARRPTELFIKPFARIPDAPWFVVTLRDKQWLETVNSEVLLKSIAWSLVALTPLFLLFVIVRFTGRKHAGDFWPDPGKAAFYRGLALVSAAVLTLGLAATAFLTGAWLFRVSLAFPLLVGGAAITSYVVWTRMRTPETIAGAASRSSYRRWYYLAIAALWACTAVVPAAGLFRHGWKLEFAKLGHLEQQRATRHKASWAAEDRDWWQHVSMPGLDDFLARRLRHVESYWLALEPYYDPVPPPGSATLLETDRWLDRLLPFYNDATESLRYQIHDRRWQTDYPSLPGEVPRHLKAGVTLNWQAVLTGLLTIGAAWWWLRYKDRHLLWSHLAAAAPRAFQDLKTLVDQRRLVAFLTPSEHERSKVAGLFAVRSKASAAALQAGTFGAAATTSELAPWPVDAVVEDFEKALLASGGRQKIIERLERAVAAAGDRAVIICRTDPLHFLSHTNGGGEHPDLHPDLPSGERDRWLRTLEPFVVHVTAVGQTEGNGTHDPPMCDAYFDSLWRYCTQPEKLMLVQVAEEGFANPHQARVLERLIEKGLVKLAPHLMLMNRPFEAFILERARSIGVKAWERPEGALGWTGIRWILGFLLVGVLVLLAVTQGSWFKSAAAMLTGIAASMEALSQLLHAAQRSQQVVGD